MATDIIARGMAANAKKSVTELGDKVESEKWIGTKAEWEAVDKSTIKDGTIVYITDDKTVILYDKAEMEKIAAQVATDRKAAETAAQTAQAVADSLPDDYTTAVEKIAENTAEISAVKLTDKELTRRVDALYSIGQGITHQFETDSDTVYAKTVPTGAKLMSVKNIGGRSIVFNQFAKNKPFDSRNGITTSTDGNYSVLDGTATNAITAKGWWGLKLDEFSPTNGHKYLFCSKIISGTVNPANGCTIGTAIQKQIVGKSFIFEMSDKHWDSNWLSAIYSDKDTVFNKLKFSVMLIDLTAMFGSGNEPSTVEEFEAIFPNNYYPYNVGEIVSAGTEEVVEQGKNLLNADDYYASYKQSDGSYVNNSMGFANINIPIGKYIGKTLVATLKATVSAQPTSFFWLARIDGARVESSYAKGERVPANTTGIAKLTFTPKTQKDTLSMTYGQGTGDVIVRDIQIELSDTPTAYAPYHSNVYQIPEAIKALPGYGWSAGTARNYVDYENKKYVQCVNSVDLGTLDWKINTTSSVGNHFYGSVKHFNFKYLGAFGTTVYNVLCSKYRTVARSSNVFVDKTITVDGVTVVSQIQVKDTAYPDATAFKKAMQGVMLYYELETPIVTDISDLLADDFLRNLTVEAGGSITFKNSNDSYRIPVPSEEEYIVKLSEIGGTT